MANIFDYLEWRSDVPFSCDPFNEVDNLVLAQLAYTDFDGCIPEDKEDGATLKEIYEQYYHIHTREEILARTSFIAKAPLLMDKMIDSKRYGNIRLKGYVNYINDEKSQQMSAVQMYLSDGTVYLAYRGTDDTFTGWKEDLCFSYMEETAGQRESLLYMNEHFLDKSVKLRVGGHSKGGNFAIYASAFCDASIQENIIEVYSNDAPGFMYEITMKEQYQKLLPKIKAIVPEYNKEKTASIIDYISNADKYSQREKSFLDSLETNAKGLMQHDANTWQVIRNHFIEVEERSANSILADKTIRGWLKDLSLEDREVFVQTIFEVLESSGAACVSEFNRSIIANVPKIVMKLSSLPKEKLDNFKMVIVELAKSYIGETTDSLGNGIKEAANNLKKKLSN